jgi:hypothetical protein
MHCHCPVDPRRQEIATYAAAVATLDLRTPHTWYPYARAIKRKIIYHGGEWGSTTHNKKPCRLCGPWACHLVTSNVGFGGDLVVLASIPLRSRVLSYRHLIATYTNGAHLASCIGSPYWSRFCNTATNDTCTPCHNCPPPPPLLGVTTGPTNSGKTYNALQSLAAAERGIYCAPLRLLAMEVYETLNHRGTYCNLVSRGGSLGLGCTEQSRVLLLPSYCCHASLGAITAMIIVLQTIWSHN